MQPGPSVEDWHSRWATGRTGWHEPGGNAALKAHWPPARSTSGKPNRVLVPLCGKSPDLMWLAKRGFEVVGVELAEIPVQQFFAENNLEFKTEKCAALDRYTASELPLTLYCGDYFQFSDAPFDALYDRGSLVALPPSMRPAYAEQTHSLLLPDATIMIITLEYDQSVVQGPPYAVSAGEIRSAWGELSRIAETDDLDNCPPKFRAAGLKEVYEVVWFSG